MIERWVKYTSNGQKTRAYKVVGSFIDTIMYGSRRGSKVRCLRLEKPWAPGETFAVLADRCEDIPLPDRSSSYPVKELTEYNRVGEDVPF